MIYNTPQIRNLSSTPDITPMSEFEQLIKKAYQLDLDEYKEKLKEVNSKTEDVVHLMSIFSLRLFTAVDIYRGRVLGYWGGYTPKANRGEFWDDIHPLIRHYSEKLLNEEVNISECEKKEVLRALQKKIDDQVSMFCDFFG